MIKAQQQLLSILETAKKNGINSGDVLQLPVTRKLLAKKKRNVLPAIAVVTIIFLMTGYFCELFTHRGFTSTWFKWKNLNVHDHMCTVPMPDQMTKIFRPPENCSICLGIASIEKLSSLFPSKFEDKYAYSGHPVVITDAQDNWSARETFSFEFFKSLYDEHSQANCQFFPYDTEFTNLQQAFNMSSDRAKMRKNSKPWYIGWSNCDDKVARILRQHYKRPYFLPSTAESKRVDWIFMGSTGFGAHMHVDNVEYPSWQAQLRGSKLWLLQPPPECFYQCQPVEVVVHPGETIVLDTNRWYHKTVIVSEELSITIGAEYD